MTILATALWLSASYWVFTGTRAQDCGENVVKMVTVPDSYNCNLRFNAAAMDSNSDRTETAVQAGRELGTALYQREIARERNIVSSGVSVQRATPEYHHYLSTTPNLPAAQFFNRSLLEQCLATEIGAAVAQEYGLPPYLAGDILLHLNLSADPALCTPTPVCNASASYRSYDGSCNNLQHPKWGMAGEPFTRLLLPVYDDGIYSPRKASDGSELPSARLLRTMLIPGYNVSDEINTLVAMQWGQIVAHDVAGTFDQIGSDGLGIMCCTDDGQHLNASLLSNGCLPIDVPADDYYLSQFGRRCMSVQRSNATFALNCRISAAEDLNGPNHYIDASIVYGNSLNVANAVRAFNGGRLRVSVDSNRDMLPLSLDPVQNCDLDSNDTCYVAGDARVNQNPQLTALQLILMREHNRMVRELEQLNPSWSDETLYQEVRRILAAIIQHITYKELVPIYLGSDFSLAYDLLPVESDYNRGYNPELNPNTLNSFTGAAYRAFHGLVQGELDLVDESRCPYRPLVLSDWFNRPSVVQSPPENLDSLLRGVVTQPGQRADDYTAEELSDRMFRSNKPYGQDISALDIVRARDRGIASYNDFRELCKLGRASTFEDFLDNISDEVEKMAALYAHPDDVDLFVGGYLETPAYGSLLGPTFHCIVGEQFYRYKFGDRFWYEFGEFEHSFTQVQLNEIRNMSLSRLLCDNGDNITQIQPDCFRHITPQNPLVSCNNSVIPRMNLTVWKT